MKRLSILLIVCSVSLNSLAADGLYAVSKIPAALTKQACAVKRFEEIKFEVLSLSKARMYRKFAITILDEHGDEYAELQEWYDRFNEINSIDGTLYDAQGNKIKSLKKADIKDLSGTDDISLADDNRYKQFSFYHRVYPYTVEFELESTKSYTMFYPGYHPVAGTFYSVQQSKMTVILNDGIEFRYLQSALDNPEIKQEGSRKIYTWQLKDFAAIEPESYRPHWREIAPTVHMAPVMFEVQKYRGSMNSWDDFGKFIIALKSQRDELPTSVREKVHQLTDQVTDLKEKIRLLYRYMQENTRYVSVQLGVGGWQPYDAKYVAERKYGDCKALANYMYALLKEAGIRSCYTLIKAGDGNKFFLPDFPSSQFNHIILAVPLQKDTVWLECTNQNMPAGYLGGFTEDRYALMVTETGAALVRTPRYDYRVNTQQRQVQVVIDATGQANIQTSTQFQAMAQDDLHGLYHAFSKEKVKEYLNQSISLPQYELVDFSYQEQRGALPVMLEKLHIVAKNFATVSGKRLFVVPNLFSRSGTRLEADTTRKYDIVFSGGYTDVDSVEIIVPDGYQVEALPAPVQIGSLFGRYEARASVDGNKIKYYRRMEKYSGRYPASDFPSIVHFFDKIYKADRMRLVLVK